MIWVWHHACFIRHIHDICVNLCHLLFLCNYILFWLVQQYLKTAPGSADRHIVTLLQPVVESGLGTCAPSIDPPHIVTLLCWARQCNGGEERSKLLVGTKNLRFPQKLQGVIFDPRLSVLGVIVIFSAWITQKHAKTHSGLNTASFPSNATEP